MNKALHSRDDVDRIYMSRKDEGRGLASVDVPIKKQTTRRLYRKARRKTDYNHQKQYERHEDQYTYYI